MTFTVAEWWDATETNIENAPTQGSTALLAGSDDTSFDFALTGNQAVTTSAAILTAFPFTVEALFQADQSRTNHRILFDGENFTGGYVEMAIYGGAGPVTGAGRFRVAISDGTHTKEVFSSAVVDDDTVHHVAWTAASAADWRLYIDGTDVTSYLNGRPASSAVTFPNIVSGWSIGNTPGASYGDQGFGGNAAHLVIWDYAALSSTRIQAHATAALTAWAGDTTAERATRVLNAGGWPTSERNIGTGVSTVGIAGYGGSMLSYLQTLADTENGLAHMNGSGQYEFVGRHALLSQARTITSQATFADDGTGLEFSFVEPSFNNTTIRNRVQVTRAGGVPIVAKDDTSIQQYGLRSYDRATLSDSDQDARNVAQWILDHYKDPQLRFNRLTILPRKDPSNLWPQALGRKIGDRITIRLTPQGVGDPIEKDVLIEGISHTVTPDNWVTVWDLTPAETLRYWILGTSELGIDTRLAY